jgi:hypothetical protein
MSMTAMFPAQIQTDLQLMAARTMNIPRLLGSVLRPELACARLYPLRGQIGRSDAATSRVRCLRRLMTHTRRAGTEPLIRGGAAVVAVAAAFPAVRSTAGEVGRYHHSRRGPPCQGLGAAAET